MVVISMKKSWPWREIFEQGQMPTWIRQCQALEIPVFTLESKSPSAAVGLAERFVERWRYGRFVGHLVRSCLRIAHLVLPPSEITWGVIPGDIPRIIENSSSSYLTFFRRNGALFDWFLNETSHELLYRVHSSSFIDPAGLQSFVAGLDTNASLVAGKTEFDSQGREFLSGAGILFTRAAVALLNTSFRDVRRDLPEDVGLSLLFASHHLERASIERVDYETLQEATVHSIPEGIFHFRCKSRQRPEGDIQIMQLLGRYFFQPQGGN